MMMTSFRKYCHYDVKFISCYSNSALGKKLKYISNNSTAALSCTEKSCEDHLANVARDLRRVKTEDSAHELTFFDFSKPFSIAV